MIRTELKKIILGAIKKQFVIGTLPEISLEIPGNPAHGDYATNVALTLARTLKKNPMEIAADIAAELKIKNSEFRVEMVPPGFLNFFVSPEVLYGELGEILRMKDSYGKLKPGGPKKGSINIEFISANPTGPLTLGNGRGAFYGDALSKVLVLAGVKVIREYYINDARQSNQIQELGKAILGKGELYPGPYTDGIRRRLFKKYTSLKKMDSDAAGFLAAQEIQKDNRRFVERVLNIKFDVWYPEEKLYRNKLVEKTANELQKKGALYEKDGARWFRASGYGDTEDRVAIRTGGAPTYFLPDVAYHKEKLGKRNFSAIVDILGADHHGTFPRVLAGLKALGYDAARVRAVFMQIVRLVQDGKEIKMSKRRGQYITLDELVKDVGLDAVRYFFLEKSPDTHIDFDLAVARERSMKNPVYYVQYAHARIASILRKSPPQKIKKRNFTFLKEPEELLLIKKMMQFPEIIEDTAEDYQLHRVTRYVYDLARGFHNFYEKHRVVSDGKELTAARLALIRAVEIVFAGNLRILGISAPDKM